MLARRRRRGIAGLDFAPRTHGPRAPGRSDQRSCYGRVLRRQYSSVERTRLCAPALGSLSVQAYVFGKWRAHYR